MMMEPPLALANSNGHAKKMPDHRDSFFVRLDPPGVAVSSTAVPNIYVEAPEDGPSPRRFQIHKWATSPSYGFNLHGVAGKSFHLVGQIDEDSPAEAAGLQMGDVIIEVNSQNVEVETHDAIVAHIQSDSAKVSLLVLSHEEYEYYASRGITVHGKMKHVRVINCPPRIPKGQFISAPIVRKSSARPRTVHIPEDKPEPTKQSLNNMPTEFRFTSRHLSASEILTDLLQNQGADVLLHVAILQSRMRITEGLLHRALHILARFQPALRMRIATESGQRHAINRRFVEMEHVGVECDVIRGTDRKSWLAAAEVELQQPFEADTGPLWKVRYIEFTNMDDTASIASTSSRRSSSGSTGGGRHEGALFLKIHPAIADGVSIFDLLHGQLISILNTVSRDGDLTRFQTALSMLPSADESFSEKNKFIWSKKDSVRLLSDEEPVVERFRPAFT